jgi:hypothetical protein
VRVLRVYTARAKVIRLRVAEVTGIAQFACRYAIVYVGALRSVNGAPFPGRLRDLDPPPDFKICLKADVPDAVAGRMENWGRDAHAAVIHGQCLPAAGKFARLGRGERSVSSRMGTFYCSRFFMNHTNNGMHRGTIADRAVNASANQCC